MSAFDAADRAGADWVETDVQFTRDDVPVLIHDRSVERTSDGHGLVGKTSLARIQTFDAGAWFGPAFAGQRIPSLSLALRHLSTLRPGLLLELKQRMTRDQVAMILDLLDSTRMGARSIVTSFFPKNLRHAHELSPRQRLGLLVWNSPAPLAALLKVHALYYMPRHSNVSPEIVTLLHAAGRRVVPWIVDDAPSWRRMAGLGVDGVVTNDPRALRRWQANACLGPDKAV